MKNSSSLPDIRVDLSPEEEIISDYMDIGFSQPIAELIYKLKKGFGFWSAPPTEDEDELLRNHSNFEIKNPEELTQVIQASNEHVALLIVCLFEIRTLVEKNKESLHLLKPILWDTVIQALGTSFEQIDKSNQNYWQNDYDLWENIIQLDFFPSPKEVALSLVEPISRGVKVSAIKYLLGHLRNDLDSITLLLENLSDKKVQDIDWILVDTIKHFYTFPNGYQFQLSPKVKNAILGKKIDYIRLNRILSESEYTSIYIKTAQFIGIKPETIYEEIGIAQGFNTEFVKKLIQILGNNFDKLPSEIFSEELKNFVKIFNENFVLMFYLIQRTNSINYIHLIDWKQAIIGKRFLTRFRLQVAESFYENHSHNFVINQELLQSLLDSNLLPEPKDRISFIIWLFLIEKNHHGFHHPSLTQQFENFIKPVFQNEELYEMFFFLLFKYDKLYSFIVAKKYKEVTCKIPKCIINYLNSMEINDEYYHILGRFTIQDLQEIFDFLPDLKVILTRIGKYYGYSDKFIEWKMKEIQEDHEYVRYYTQYFPKDEYEKIKVSNEDYYRLIGLTTNRKFRELERIFNEIFRCNRNIQIISEQQMAFCDKEKDKDKILKYKKEILEIQKKLEDFKKQKVEIIEGGFKDAIDLELQEINLKKVLLPIYNGSSILTYKDVNRRTFLEDNQFNIFQKDDWYVGSVNTKNELIWSEFIDLGLVENPIEYVDCYINFLTLELPESEHSYKKPSIVLPKPIERYILENEEAYQDIHAKLFERMPKNFTSIIISLIEKNQKDFNLPQDVIEYFQPSNEGYQGLIANLSENRRIVEDCCKFLNLDKTTTEQEITRFKLKNEKSKFNYGYQEDNKNENEISIRDPKTGEYNKRPIHPDLKLIRDKLKEMVDEIQLSQRETISKKVEWLKQVFIKFCDKGELEFIFERKFIDYSYRDDYQIPIEQKIYIFLTLLLELNRIFWIKNNKQEIYNLYKSNNFGEEELSQIYVKTKGFQLNLSFLLICLFGENAISTPQYNTSYNMHIFDFSHEMHNYYGQILIPYIIYSLGNNLFLNTQEIEEDLFKQYNPYSYLEKHIKDFLQDTNRQHIDHINILLGFWYVTKGFDFIFDRVFNPFIESKKYLKPKECYDFLINVFEYLVNQQGVEGIREYFEPVISREFFSLKVLELKPYLSKLFQLLIQEWETLKEDNYYYHVLSKLVLVLTYPNFKENMNIGITEEIIQELRIKARRRLDDLRAQAKIANQNTENGKQELEEMPICITTLTYLQDKNSEKKNRLWESLKVLLLAFRYLNVVTLDKDLSVYNIHYVNMEYNWKTLSFAIKTILKQTYKENLEVDQRLNKNTEINKQIKLELRKEFLHYLLDSLKPRKDKKGVRGEREIPEHFQEEGWAPHLKEPHPIWRRAYIEAAADLGVNPGGKAHFVLEKVQKEDPSSEVKDAAKRAARRMRKLKNGVKEGSSKRMLLNAWWWLRYAHVISLGGKVDEEEAIKTRSKEVREQY